MHPTLALELSTTVLVIVGVISVILLVLIIVAPWRQVRAEPPLDPAVEARLLMHRNPDEATGEVPRVAGVPTTNPVTDPDPAADSTDSADYSDLADLADEDDK